MKAKKKAHKKKVEQAKHMSDKLDQALENSFPSSDPIQLSEPAPIDETTTDDEPPRRREEEDEQPSAPA